MTPGQLWQTWSLQPAVLLALAATALFYGWGLRRLWIPGHRGRGIRWPQALAFYGGLLALFVALVSPLHPLSQQLLSAHMAQHFLILMVAAPLLILGAPPLALSAAVSGRWRRQLHRLGERKWLHEAGRALTHPVITWLLAAAMLWAWHIPSLYQAALRGASVHALEHASFLVTALLFWWTAIHPSGRRRLPRGGDVLYVFTGAFQGAALGALFTFAASPVYPFYAARVAAWGLTPLQDQQLAGVIMWIPSGVIYLAVACVMFVKWLRAVERDTRRAEARTAPA